jgi:uncharacterized protein YjbI with pentapeptide repeats
MPQAPTCRDWDDQDREAALNRAAEGIIKEQGSCLNADQLNQLLEAAPEDDERPGRRKLGAAAFCKVTFTEDVDFRQTTFTGGANFTDVTFRGRACFADARFGGNARFERVMFKRQADFRDTTWVGDVRFVDATAQQVILDGAIFDRRATLHIDANCLSAVRTEFRAGTDIVAQSAEITFQDAIFGDASTLMPPMGKASTPGRAARRGRNYSEVLWSMARILTCGRAGRDRPARRAAGRERATGERQPEPARIPKVLSLRGARVIDLALSGVDLRSCHFRGAHGLASIRLEQVLLAEPPEGWTKARRPWPFCIRWTRRAAIAEEHWWRADHKFDGWKKPDWQDARDTEAQTPTPHQIAAVYRLLRKSREDNKDEPGAADFYYGEMEMRRHSEYRKPPCEAPPLDEWAGYDDTRRPPRGEKAILRLYWLVSGYGLRASRALLSLAVMIVLGAIPLYLWDFRPKDRSYGHALLFSLESSISLLRAPEAMLTDGSEVIQLLLRLAGPLFFGLALLALRGRVKR